MPRVVRRRARRGFTLLEVIIALTLTAVAVTIAASALRAATTARKRVLAHERHDGQWMRFRAQLTDMLRHAPSAESVNEPLLQVTHDALGNATLTFLSTGVRAPFGTGPAWRVTVSAQSGALTLDAVPVGRTADDATRLHTVLSGAIDSDTTSTRAAMRVQLLERAGGLSGAQWRENWPLERARPAAVALTFGDARTAPIQVALDPLPAGGGRP